MPHFEFYATRRRPWVKRQWYWRLVASNGRKIADSAEGYSTRHNVLRAINSLNEWFTPSLHVMEVDR